MFAVYCLMAKPEPTLALADLGKALILINFAVIAMSTLAVVFATRLDIVANLCVCSVVFFLGLISSYLFQRQTDSDALNLVFGALYAILPNWQYFWLADAVAVNRPIPDSYVINAAIYMVIYVSVDVGRRDLPEQGDRRGQPRVTGLSVRFSVAAVFTAAFL